MTGQGCSGHGPVAVWAAKSGTLCWCEGPSAEFHFPVGCHVQCSKVSGTVTALDETSGRHTVRLDSDGGSQTHYLAYYFKLCCPPLGSVTYPDGVQVCSCGKPSPEEAVQAAAAVAEAAEAARQAAERKSAERKLTGRAGGSKRAEKAADAVQPAEKKTRSAVAHRNITALPSKPVTKASTRLR